MRKKGQKWNYELLHKTALKYDTTGAFKRGCRSAYDACRRRGLLDEVCKHMERTPRTFWTDEMLYAKARKYKTRGEFKKGNLGAYHACLRRGLLDEVCKHMERTPHYK